MHRVGLLLTANNKPVEVTVMTRSRGRGELGGRGNWGGIGTELGEGRVVLEGRIALTVRVRRPCQLNKSLDSSPSLKCRKLNFY